MRSKRPSWLVTTVTAVRELMLKRLAGSLDQDAKRDTEMALQALDLLWEELEGEGEMLTREHEGTGLGLSIVKELKQGMGGSVEVDSAPGHGTRFIVRLPGAGGDDFTDGSRAPNRDVTQVSDNPSPSELHVTHAQSEADES